MREEEIGAKPGETWEWEVKEGIMRERDNEEMRLMRRRRMRSQRMEIKNKETR